MKRTITLLFIASLLIVACSSKNDISHSFSSQSEKSETSNRDSDEIVPGNLSFYYPWIDSLKENNIAAIYSIDHARGNPTLANFEVWNIASKEEITQTVNYLKSVTISEGKYDPQRPGEVPSEIVINTKQGESYSVSLFSNVVQSSYEKNVSYYVSEPLPSFASFYAYSLNYYGTQFTVTDISNGTDATNRFTFASMSKMLFIPVEGIEFLAVMNEYNRYKFENAFGYIIFQGEKMFTLHDNQTGLKTYQIINDVTFSSFKK